MLLKQFESSNAQTGEDTKNCTLSHLSSLKFYFTNYFTDVETEI